MEDLELQYELASIRGLMERSSKFISLSGLSGILAGIYALIGAAVAHHLIDDTLHEKAEGRYTRLEENLFLVAVAVFVASVITGVILTMRKAKKNGQSVWGVTSRALLFSMAIPLISGGMFVLILIYQGYPVIIAAVTLIFYGLSLVSAGNYTFTLVKYLGVCEIALGLAAACFPGYGLCFWAIGFGVLHIIYGSLMYLKYDR